MTPKWRPIWAAAGRGTHRTEQKTTRRQLLCITRRAVRVQWTVPITAILPKENRVRDRRKRSTSASVCTDTQTDTRADAKILRIQEQISNKTRNTR